MTAVERIDKAIAKAWETTPKDGDGDQIVDGVWRSPIWGCDSLGELREECIAAIRAAEIDLLERLATEALHRVLTHSAIRAEIKRLKEVKA